jgi:hypothetical protein
MTAGSSGGGDDDAIGDDDMVSKDFTYLLNVLWVRLPLKLSSSHCHHWM